MINSTVPIEFWHRPPGCRFTSAIPIVMPVGPDHDPVPSLESSLRASRGAPPLVHILVLNGSAAPADRGASIVRRVQALTTSFLLMEVRSDIGYVRAVELGLRSAAEVDARSDRVGFIDADSELRSPTHWAVADAALAEEPDLVAISGLVVHPRCEVWETLSSARFVDAMTRASGGPISKPYLQGGAGGTLARRAEFAAAVDAALAMGTLIGPTLSAASIARGRYVRATGQLPCGHTQRTTLDEWITSVTNYERSWHRLIQLHGRGIETPWRGFLDHARCLLRDDPALMRDVAENQRLRRQVVEVVEREAANDWRDALNDHGSALAITSVQEDR